MGFLSDVVSPVQNFLCVGAKHVQSITAFVSRSNSETSKKDEKTTTSWENANTYEDEQKL